MHTKKLTTNGKEEEEGREKKPFVAGRKRTEQGSCQSLKEQNCVFRRSKELPLSYLKIYLI
jgi:hypothetical protein